MGGAVRDALSGSTKHMKDIDIAFGCTAVELKSIAQQQQWQNCKVINTGRVVLGLQTGCGLEGKSIRGTNSDEIKFPNQICTLSNDLAMECLCKDFTCNCLFFDPQNKVICDPSGYGYHDAMNKQLRIPVDQQYWLDWVNGNPKKLFRYWVMKAKGYSAIDVQTHNFIVSEFKSRKLKDNTIYKNLNPKAQQKFQHHFLLDMGWPQTEFSKYFS